MKVLKPLISAFGFSLLVGIWAFNGVLAQAPDLDLIADLEAAIEAEEVIKIETVTQQAANLVFIGPIEDNMARGIVSVSVPIPNVTHMTLRLVQPGGAVAHTATLESEDRWGGVFAQYKFGIDLQNIGIQKGAMLVVDLYQGGRAVAHAEKILPEQSSRPDYVVAEFEVEAAEEGLSLNYDFTSVALQPVVVVPQVTVTNQNVEEGQILLQKFMPAVQVEAKSAESFSHQVDLPKQPGLYEVVVWLFDEKKELLTGALRETFVVEGAYGVFESVTLYFDEEAQEHKLIVKGGAVGAQEDENLTLMVLAEPVVKGAVGRALIDSQMAISLTGAQRFREDLEIDLSDLRQGRLEGQVQIRLGDRIIGEKEFSFLVGGDLAPEETVLPVGQDRPSLLSFERVVGEDKAIGWVLVGLGILILLIVLWWFWRWRRKRSKMLMVVGMLLLSTTAWAQSTTLVNTWYYPLADWIYNPLATGEFENFRYVRFDGNVFNPLTQQGFFQLDPDAILIRFINGTDYRYAQAFTFTVTDNKKYQLDIPVPTDLSEADWDIEVYFQYQGSWYVSAWEDEITTNPYHISVDKTEPVLQQFTYDGSTYTASEQLLWPNVEGLESDETTLLQDRKSHFLDLKANEVQKKSLRDQRKNKLHAWNQKVNKLQDLEYGLDNGTATASQITAHITGPQGMNTLAAEINGISSQLGDPLGNGEIYATGSLNNAAGLTGVATAPVAATVTCAYLDDSNQPDLGTYNDCVQHHQGEISTLNPQITTKRAEIRTAKARFKNAGIGVEFVCNDTGAGCNPTCNMADGQCDIDCGVYPQSCAQYQTDNPGGYAANCSGSPLSCMVDCISDPLVCSMRGLLADVRGNFCDDDTYCDDQATRRFQACDNVGNCVSLSNEAVETDWYDPVEPNLGSLKVTRNKDNEGGTETVLNLQTTEGGNIVNCITEPSGFGGGDGGPSTPYQICDVDQLQNVQNALSSYFIITTNIDASATTAWNSGAGFAPIGTSGTPFTGSLDGNGKVIKDLYINATGVAGGLFGFIGGNGTVFDLGLVNVDVTVTGGSLVGGLVGSLNSGDGDFSNVYVTGSVSQTSSSTTGVGGLIGGISAGTGDARTIDNVSSTATVSSQGQDVYVGGLIGLTSFSGVGSGQQTVLEKARATGDVTGTGTNSAWVGGLIGAWLTVPTTTQNTLFKDLYSSGDVSSSHHAGGIMAVTGGTGGDTVSVEDSYATGLISGVNTAGILHKSSTATNNVEIGESYFLQTATINAGVTVDDSSGAIVTNSFGVSDVLMQAGGSATDNTQPYFGWSDTTWNFGTVNNYPTLFGMPSFNEDIAGNSGTLAAADRLSFEIAAADVVNPNAVTYPTLFDTHACGSSSADGFFLGNSGDPACSQRYTACALSSNLRGTKDNLLGTACGVACPTVTYDIDGQMITETYQRQGDLCVPTCDYRLFDGCFPFLLIGETCQNVSWLPLETSIDEGVVFTQTSNCGDTRNWTGTKPITQSIKHFLDGKNVFGVYFYDTFNDSINFFNPSYRGQFTIDTDGFAQTTSGTVTADWQHEVGYSPDGGNVLKIESTSLSGGYAAWERTGIPVTPTVPYVLTYWVKTNATQNRDGSGAWPVIYDGGTTNISSQYATTMTSVSDGLSWEKVEVYFTPSSNTIDVQLRLEAQDGRLAYFDDVVVFGQNWRYDNTQSWYNEAKGDDIDGTCDYITGDGDGDPRGGGDVRCGSDYFPEKAVVAFTDDGVWLLDAIDGVMWMSSLRDPGGGWRFVFNILLSGKPFASNAKLISAFRFDQGGGRNGAVVIGDFVNDTMYSHRMSNCFTLSGFKGVGSSSSNTPCTWATQNARNWTGFVNDPISGRNVDRNPWTTFMPPNIALANHQINDMHSNIIGGVEYVVVAHDFAGITVLDKTNDTVQYIEFDGSNHNDPGYPEWDDLPSTANMYRSVHLANDGRLYYLWDSDADSRTRLHVIDDVTALPFNGSVISGNSSWDQRIQPNNSSSSYPTTALDDSANSLDVKDDRILIGSSGSTPGFDLYKGLIDGGSQHPNLAKQRVTRSYASAPLYRDVWGHWTTSVQDVSGKANDLSNVGGVGISVTNLGADLQQFNFDNNAYLQTAASAMTGIGNAITFGTWVFTDTTAEDGGYLIAQKDVVDTEFALYRTADNKLRVEGAASHTVNAYTLSGWNFVTASFDGTTKRAYIDGVKVLEVADVIGTASGGSSLDPSNLTYLDEYDDNNGSNSLDGASSVEVVGNIAYVTGRQDDTFQIFDISDPANITRLGGLSDSRLDGAYDVAINGNYAYIVSDIRDSLTIWDISNPASPSFVGEERDTGNLNGARGVALQGNYAYVAARQDDSLSVIDISNPASPNYLGQYDSNSNMDQPYDVKVSGNYAYVAASSEDALVVIDISNPNSPSYAGRFQDGTLMGGARAVELQGNYAFVACYDRDALAVIDISNPTSPSHVGELRMTNNLNGARGITIDGDYAFVTAFADDSLQVIDITTPTTPTWVGEYQSNNSMNGAIDAEVVGDKIYVASYNDDSLVTLDIGETVSGLRLKLGAGEDGGGTTTLLDGAMALPFVAQEAYTDQNVRDLYNGTRDWFGENILITLQGTSDDVVEVKFGDFGSYFVATDGGGITHFDYSGRVLRTISAAPTSESNVSIVSNAINAIDYRNGWLIIGYQGRGVEIVNIAPEVSEILSLYDDAEFDPYFFY